MAKEKDIRSRSWFCVFNNPAKHGYEGTPQEVCEKLKAQWLELYPNGTGAWIYCICPKGLHHVHFVVENTSIMTFNHVKKTYCKGAHFEITKGNKKQVEDYINKTGVHEEKGEVVLHKTVHGELKGRQGNRSDLVTLKSLISDGLLPDDIIDENPNAFRYRTFLEYSYMRKKESEISHIRNVEVHWLYGKTGTGKSYTYVKLLEEHGKNNITSNVHSPTSRHISCNSNRTVIYPSFTITKCPDNLQDWHEFA